MTIMQLQAKPINTCIKIDPRTKIFLLLIINMIVLIHDTSREIILIKFFVTLIAVGLLIASNKAKFAIVFLVVYTLSLNVEILFVFISKEIFLGAMLRIVTGLITFIGPCTIMGYFLISTTRASEFIAAMEKIHLPTKFIIPFAVMFRFFPTIKEEYNSIQDAMKLRGISFKNGILTAIEYRMVPLMVSVVKIGDELSAASLTRGLGVNIKRTNTCKIGFGIYDVIFSCLVTGSLILCFIL